MTAPRAFASEAASRANGRRRGEPIFTAERVFSPAVAARQMTYQPAPPAPPQPLASHPDLAAPVTRNRTASAGPAGRRRASRKITLIGVGQNESVTLTPLTLARLLVRKAKVVLVELSISSPTVGAVSAIRWAPGLSDLMLVRRRSGRSSPRTGCRKCICGGGACLRRIVRCCSRRVWRCHRRAAAGVRPRGARCRNGGRSSAALLSRMRRPSSFPIRPDCGSS